MKVCQRHKDFDRLFGLCDKEGCGGFGCEGGVVVSVSEEGSGWRVRKLLSQFVIGGGVQFV